MEALGVVRLVPRAGSKAQPVRNVALPFQCIDCMRFRAFGLQILNISIIQTLHEPDRFDCPCDLLVRLVRPQPGSGCGRT